MLYDVAADYGLPWADERPAERKAMSLVCGWRLHRCGFRYTRAAELACADEYPGLAALPPCVCLPKSPRAPAHARPVQPGARYYCHCGGQITFGSMSQGSPEAPTPFVFRSNLLGRILVGGVHGALRK